MDLRQVMHPLSLDKSLMHPPLSWSYAEIQHGHAVHRGCLIIAVELFAGIGIHSTTLKTASVGGIQKCRLRCSHDQNDPPCQHPGWGPSNYTGRCSRFQRTTNSSVQCASHSQFVILVVPPCQAYNIMNTMGRYGFRTLQAAYITGSMQRYLKTSLGLKFVS